MAEPEGHRQSGARRETADKITAETAHYLLSRAPSPEPLNQMARQHCRIEIPPRRTLAAGCGDGRGSGSDANGAQAAQSGRATLNGDRRHAKKTNQKALRAERSSAPAGTMAASSGYWSYFEMRFSRPAARSERSWPKGVARSSFFRRAGIHRCRLDTSPVNDSQNWPCS